MRVAVIPARGGSKRIPGKNIREFAGKPMIAHSITCALQSGLFDRVIVSTDDEGIARIAREFDAEVPFLRPAALSDDYTGTTEVVAHAVDFLLDSVVNITDVCCIYATAPFIHQEDLRRGLEVLEAGKWKYVFAATTFASPVFRSFLKSSEGGLDMLFPEHFKTRSQDLPETLHDAAQFYWGRAQAWLDQAQVYDRSSTVVIIPRWRVQDIDTEEDWMRAESIAAHFRDVQSAGRSRTKS